MLLKILLAVVVQKCDRAIYRINLIQQISKREADCANLLSLFCSTWCTVLKMFVRLFRSSESLEKRLARAISKEEKGRNGNKMSSCQLENTLTARNYHNSCHRVSSLRETHSVAKCFCDYSALSK